MKDVQLREQQQHGLPDFPVQYYYVDYNHPRYEMALHWHREFEIVRVLKGSLDLYINNVKKTLLAGDVAFVGSGMLHRAEPQDASYECVVFDLNMLCRHGSGRITGYILPLLAGDVEFERICAADANKLYGAVHSFFTCLKEEKPYFELKAYGIAAEIVYRLYVENRIRLPEKGVHTGQRRLVITSLIDWIEENYTEHLTLSRLADVAKTNEKYLCRFFKEYTGNTPIDYINRLRVERACMKLAEENFNITEAALDCGFNDVSYFSKIFKRYKGMTPREYRGLVEKHAAQQKGTVGAI